ncbi:MAG: cobalamin B12-binding domain-containing protein, partial [Lachnospiraceae bacterium]|nr:cobalamin B12-binding domain-containing protein [Lachnospiraceae bacterium]
MKFLLVALNAKYIHSNPAIYSIRRYAGELAGYVELAEYTINNRMEEILEDIYDRKPEVIGFSCYIWNREMILELIP